MDTLVGLADIVFGGWTSRQQAQPGKGEEVGNVRLVAASYEYYDGRHLW